MNAATENVVTTKDGLADASKWMRELCKYHGVTAKDLSIGETTVQNMLYCNASHSKRLDSFQAMVRRCEQGFENSAKWAKDPESKYHSPRYVSSDGRWRVTMINRYNGSGGWKVATMAVGLVVKDLSVSE